MRTAGSRRGATVASGCRALIIWLNNALGTHWLSRHCATTETAPVAFGSSPTKTMLYVRSVCYRSRYIGFRIRFYLSTGIVFQNTEQRRCRTGHDTPHLFEQEKCAALICRY